MRIPFYIKVRLAISIQLLMIFSFSNVLMAQMKRLEIQKKDSYELTSDTVVLDELVMYDSSTLILKGTSATTFIKVNRLKVNRHCSIVGVGTNGTSAGRSRNAETYNGVCRQGRPGIHGKNGTNGGPGKSLVLEVAQLEPGPSPFIVRLNGGNGGDGGDGGDGGNGSKSTSQCTCNGGDGGSGGKGGDGGASGVFTFRCVQCPPNLISGGVMSLSLLGGYGGYSGEGGRGGSIGAGSSRFSKRGANGKAGERGKDGADGKFIYIKSGGI